MKTKLTLTFVILLFFKISLSQNLFDEKHSKKYAQYLFENKYFKRASIEFERLVLLAPENSFYKTQLINSYKFSGNISKTIFSISSFFGKNSNFYSNDILNTYLQMKILQNEFIFCDSILKKDTILPIINKQEYQLAIYLLEKRYKDANSFIKNLKTEKSEKINRLIFIYDEIKKIKFKNPFFASVLSLIFPGVGKIYSNETKNGLGVLSLIGLSTWQSYRGFKKEGINSVYAWGFGAMAVGFYIGNIYGAGKSAKRENNYKNKIIKDKIIKIIVENNIIIEHPN